MTPLNPSTSSPSTPSSPLLAHASSPSPSQSRAQLVHDSFTEGNTSSHDKIQARFSSPNAGDNLEGSSVSNPAQDTKLLEIHQQMQQMAYLQQMQQFQQQQQQRMQAILSLIQNGFPTALHELARFPNHDEACRAFFSSLDLLYPSHLYALDQYGSTPLHVAAQAGNYNLYVAFHSFGADPTLKDSFGLTPWDIITRLGIRLDDQFSRPAQIIVNE